MGKIVSLVKSLFLAVRPTSSRQARVRSLLGRGLQVLVVVVKQVMVVDPKRKL
jgi:hypothetical protein